MDLIQDFFERDLSDAEFEALAARLDSEEEALRFAEEASRFQAALGAAAAGALALKLAQASKTAVWSWSALAKGVLLKTAMAAGTVAAVGGGGYLLHQALQPAAPAPAIPVAPAAAPAVAPAPLPARKSGSEILLKLKLRENASVEALVLDGRGQTVRHLGTKAFEAGSHSWPWDGLDDQGQRLAPGNYQVLLRYNGKEVKQPVRVRARR